MPVRHTGGVLSAYMLEWGSEVQPGGLRILNISTWRDETSPAWCCTGMGVKLRGGGNRRGFHILTTSILLISKTYLKCLNLFRYLKFKTSLETHEHLTASDL